MALTTLDWVIIIGFFAISLIIGLSMAKKASGSMENFFLGGRKMPWLLAGVSMVATTFAADTPLAVAELVGQSGISGNWLWWSFLAGGMLTTFFFASLWHKAGVLTEVELIEFRYSGIQAAILRGFKSVYLGLFINVLIMGWVNLALLSILEIFFGLSPADGFKYVLIAMFVAAAYSSLSGIWGVAVTDAVQFVIAMTGTIILAVLIMQDPQIGGIAGLKEKLPEWRFNFFPRIGESLDGVGMLSLSLGSFLAYISVQWWASWYPGAEPGGGGYIAQRFMSTKNPKHATYATLFFQVAHYCIRPWPWILVALACLVLYPELDASNYKEGYVMAMRDFLPAGLKGLLLTAFLAAYMSTISTQLNWGSSYLVNDFYKRFMKPKSSEKQLVMASRVCTLILMFIAAIVSTFLDSITGVWVFLIECGAGLGLVLILRWYWWRINAWSEIVATVSPFIGYAISKYVLGFEFPNSFFLTVGFCTVSWLIATAVTKPTSSETLRRFYEKVQPQGWWEPIRKTTSIAKAPSKLGAMTLAWLAAVLFCYSLLFTMGYLILQEWTNFWYALACSAVSVIGLVYLIQKKKVIG